jgi:nicotinamidase-related amidase
LAERIASVTDRSYALIVVDMQPDFFERNDLLAAQRAALAASIMSSFEHFEPVIHLSSGFDRNFARTYTTHS